MSQAPFPGALPPPAGVIPNVINPTSSVHSIWLVTTILCLIIPSILVPIRSYIRYHIVKTFKLADYICVLAWLTLLGVIVTSFILYGLGVGLHGWDVLVEQYDKFSKVIDDQQIIYIPSILLTKVAILTQLEEIFVPDKRNSRWYILQGLIILNTLFFTIQFFIRIFECTPRVKIWRPSTPGKCLNSQAAFVTTGAMNVFDDFVIFVLPLCWIWKLHIPPKKKAGICVVFATGLFACISSIMRLVESIRSIGSKDITYTLMPVSLWATAELASGLVVCCLPVLPRLLQYVRAKSGSTGSFSSRKYPLSKASSRRYREVDDISLGQVPLSYTTVQVQHSRRKDLEPTSSTRDDNLEQNFELERTTMPQPAILQTITIDLESSARSP